MAFEPMNIVEVTSASPTGRSSATLVMLGLGLVITPSTTGRLYVVCTGNVATGTSGDGYSAQLYYGTGGAPSNNTAVTGTAFGQLVSVASLVTTELSQSFAASGLITGLAVPSIAGTGKAQAAAVPIWVDIAFKFATGGTVTFTNMDIIAMEV